MLTSADPSVSFDVEKVRKDFPILKQQVYGKPLVYLDNAATTQKPQEVIDAIVKYYTEYNSNIHRGVHSLSQKASKAYDDVREKVRGYINASSEREIIFVRGTTEAINLVASTYGRKFIGEGDEILISEMEHHSNIVPWQLLAEEKGATLKVIPMNEKGELKLDEFKKLLNKNTKFISLVYVSNSLGTINPVKEIISLAKEFNVPVMLDAAQAMAHMDIDVQNLGCDFLAFSAHKMYGPTGIGGLYGRMELLEKMPPYQGGGDMISSVSFEKTTYNEVPFKFEAGTPHIEGVIAMGAAFDYLKKQDMNLVRSHEDELVKYATERLSQIDGVRLIGTAARKAGVVSFIIEGVNSMDAGIMLDTMGIAVRTGQHCTEPVMACFGIIGTLRASFAIYNTREEVDKLVAGVTKVVSILKNS